MDNATRTRDLLNHNQLLYRLSYIHHVCIRRTGLAQQMDTIHDFVDMAYSASRKPTGEGMVKQCNDNNTVFTSLDRFHKPVEMANYRRFLVDTDS